MPVTLADKLISHKTPLSGKVNDVLVSAAAFKETILVPAPNAALSSWSYTLAASLPAISTTPTALFLVSCVF